MSEITAPIEIGGVKIRNRTFLPGHTTNFGMNNLPTDRNIDYLASRANGGVGLIISEAIRVHPTSAGRSSTLGASDDRCIPSYQKLTAAVHKNGAAIFAQIMHAGRQANGDATHTAAWSASEVPWTLGGQIPHVMSHSDISIMVKAFGNSAKRMQSAEFDGLEVHLGHGHLIQQFLSPVSNTRTDKYGGSLENRMRFAVEVLEEIYKSVPNMCIGIRISADEFMPNGLTPDAMLEIVDKLNAAFNFNFLHVSHSAYHGSYSVATQIADMSFGHAPFRKHAALFRDNFPSIPLLAVCRLDSISEAAELIDSGEADMVGLARPMIADPEIMNKFISNKDTEVTSCIACNQECIGRVEKNLPISCVVNPEVGFERKWQELRSANPATQRVLVIGGGPAGMSAALSAHSFGHKVSLYEASANLGGQIRLAGSLERRSRIGLLNLDLVRKIGQTDIEVTFNKLVTDINEHYINFEKVILATGASHIARNFGEGFAAVTVEEAILKYCHRTPNDVSDLVIFDEEGSWIAASIAEQLASDGYQVHLVSPTANLFAQITLYSKLALIPRLKSLGVQIYLSAQVEVTANKVTIASSMNQQRTQIPNCLAIVDSGPRKANDELYQLAPIERAGQLHIIGDALSPRSIAEATFEGHAIGALIDLDLDLALRALES